MCVGGRGGEERGGGRVGLREMQQRKGEGGSGCRRRLAIRPN